jgi:hypothetical protein
MTRTDQVFHLLQEILDAASEVEYLLQGDEKNVTDASSELNACVRNLTNNLMNEMSRDWFDVDEVG